MDSTIIRENKIIIASTSLWLLPLLYHSFIFQWYFLSFLLTSITIVSTLFWYNYNINSIQHKLNNYLIFICFIYISSQKYYLFYNLQLYISNVSFLLTNLILSQNFELEYSFSLCTKLLYRYYFYLLIFNLIFNVNTNNVNIYLNDYTILYFINNLYSSIVVFNVKFEDFYKNYLKSCYRIITTICVYEFIRFIY